MREKLPPPPPKPPPEPTLNFTELAKHYRVDPTLLYYASHKDDASMLADAAFDVLMAELVPDPMVLELIGEERRGPGRPKIYSDDSIDRIRVSQSLADRLRLDEALRTNMLLKCLQIAFHDEGEEKM